MRELLRSPASSGDVDATISHAVLIVDFSILPGPLPGPCSENDRLRVEWVHVFRRTRTFSRKFQVCITCRMSTWLVGWVILQFRYTWTVVVVVSFIHQVFYSFSKRIVTTNACLLGLGIRHRSWTWMNVESSCRISLNLSLNYVRKPSHSKRHSCI